MDYSGTNTSQSSDFLSFNESPGSHRRDKNNQYSASSQQHGGFSNGLRQSFSPFNNRGRNRGKNKRKRSLMPSKFEQQGHPRNIKRKCGLNLPPHNKGENKPIMREEGICRNRSANKDNFFREDKTQKWRTRSRSIPRAEESSSRWNIYKNSANVAPRNNTEKNKGRDNINNGNNWRAPEIAYGPETNKYIENGDRDIWDDFPNKKREYRNNFNQTGEKSYNKIINENKSGQRSYSEIISENRSEERRYNEIIPEDRSEKKKYGNIVLDNRSGERRFDKIVSEKRSEERRCDEIIPENRSERRNVFIIPENRIGERKCNEFVTENRNERRHDEIIPENRVTERNYAEFISENRSERRYDEIIPENRIGERKYGDFIPKNRSERRYEEFIPENRIGERKYGKIMPENRSERRYDDIIPDNRIGERRHEEIIPKNRSYDEMTPENRYEDRRYNETIHLNRGRESSYDEIIHDNKNEHRSYNRNILDNRIIEFESDNKRSYGRSHSRDRVLDKSQENWDQFSKQNNSMVDANYSRNENRGWDDNWYENDTRNRHLTDDKNKEVIWVENELSNAGENVYSIKPKLPNRNASIYWDKERSPEKYTSNYEENENVQENTKGSGRGNKIVEYNIEMASTIPGRWESDKPNEFCSTNNVDTNMHQLDSHKPGPSGKFSQEHPKKEKISFSGSTQDQREVHDTFDKELFRNDLDRLSVVITNSYSIQGQITQAQSKIIKEALTKELDKVLFSKYSSPPTFKHMKYHNGLLTIFCENEYSRSWLAQIVSKLPPLWKSDAKLILVQANVFSILTKGIMYIPDEEHDVDMVKTRLSAQNSWLDIPNWAIYHHQIKFRKKKPKVAVCVFGIPFLDVKRLLDRDRNVHYGFVTLTVKLPTTVQDLLYVGLEGNTASEEGHTVNK